MLFDLFTFIAQLVNFLILVWLLKRFLYKPILKAVDEREKRITSQIQEAETLKYQAGIELDNLQKKNSELELKRNELLNTLAIEVNSEREKQSAQTRKEIENLRLQLENSIKTDQQNLSSEIRQRTRTEVFSIVRKTLVDLASVKLEEQMAEVFIERLKNQSIEEKQQVITSVSQNGSEIYVRSAFGIATKHQIAIREILKKNFSEDVKINFETTSGQLSGIELSAGGYKLVWSIENYLLSLEEGISEILSAQPQH